MKKELWNRALLVALIGLLAAVPALADKVVIEDPTGDDNGPGEYVYPTDGVYLGGSFDLTKLEVSPKGKRLNFEVSVNANLQDPWGMGVGFAIQMVFIFIDTDGEEGSGFTTVPPGLNVQFDPAHAWDKVVVLSPQTYGRVKQEVEAKGGDMTSAILVPQRVRGSGRTISGAVKLEDIGEGDPASWGYQVVMQSNEGFPDENALLTRKVNEYEGQHRFGGGSDYDCDPHAMDILGDHAMLAYECNADGSAKSMATLQMVRP